MSERTDTEETLYKTDVHVYAQQNTHFLSDARAQITAVTVCNFRTRVISGATLYPQGGGLSLICQEAENTTSLHLLPCLAQCGQLESSLKIPDTEEHAAESVLLSLFTILHTLCKQRYLVSMLFQGGDEWKGRAQ